jgi:chromosome segregation ATPase
VFARWPTPQTELESLELQHATLKQEFLAAKADVDATEEEYASMKRNLNRSAYRRRLARERYEPLIEELDQLTALINRLKTEKD